MKKKLPVGIESFEEFSKENFYYIDKTMFIAELLDNWGKVNLFTRPRRFGKSLNMSMLKSIFEIGGDKSFFHGLDILKEEEICENYMGKFPVVSISLKSVEGLTYQEACAALRRVIGREAGRFSFLLESQELLPIEKELYSGLTCVKDGTFVMSDEVLADSIRTLSEILSKHYHHKTIILIDEYDVPLNKAFQAGYYEQMVSLLCSLFGNALKTNEYLYFAVLTGCLRISKESIFTGLNNLKTHTVTDNRYDAYFGFTGTDVNGILGYYGLESYADALREWYDGYRFGSKEVYCPWDVINYCDALLEDPGAEPENYWANTSGNAMIRRFIGKADRQARSEIERLIAGEHIIKPINQELTYSELDSSIDNLWSVLFTTGYLTQRGRESGRQWKLAIPNREIRELFVNQIQEWFNDEARADGENLEKFCKAFPEGDALTIETLLNAYLWKSISIRDTAAKKEMKENLHSVKATTKGSKKQNPSVCFYHGLLLGLLQYDSNWEIESNAESGEGYSDISIKTQDKIGIVIEIKYVEDGNLKKGCMEALGQIEERQYDAALLKDRMEKIVKYGIAFYKKNSKVVVETSL